MDLTKVKEDVASRIYFHVKVKDFVKKLNTIEENDENGLGQVAWVMANDGHSFYFGIAIDDPEDSVREMIDRHNVKFHDRITELVKAELKMDDKKYDEYLTEHIDDIFFEFYTRAFIDLMMEKYGQYNFSVLKDGRFYGMEYKVDMIDVDMSKVGEMVNKNKTAQESEEFKQSAKIYNSFIKSDLLEFFKVKSDFLKELEKFKVDVLDYLMTFHDSDKAAEVIVKYFKETN